MTNALQGLLSTIGGIIAGLSPIAKTIVAAVLPLASALLNMVLAGNFNTTSIVVLVTGAVAALAVYLVPNRAAPKAKPVAPAPAATI